MDLISINNLFTFREHRDRGRARGLMETCDPGYRVIVAGMKMALLDQAGILFPGFINLAPGPATLPISFKR